uniref:Uncharacterized protein n=1 Tax=Ochrobactrum phage ORM_20 TaxID=2985243 RepID=A0A9N6WVI9_9VIRU|nr:hypothetical protein ORM20_00241 [Ochrobactrum phage ORM_20]
MVTLLFEKEHVAKIYQGECEFYHANSGNGTFFYFIQVATGDKYLFDCDFGNNRERLSNFGIDCVEIQKVENV